MGTKNRERHGDEKKKEGRREDEGETEGSGDKGQMVDGGEKFLFEDSGTRVGIEALCAPRCLSTQGVCVCVCMSEPDAHI